MQSALAIPKQASGNKEKSCRMLFGPVDHEQLRADFDEFMQKSNEEAKAKWNFGFATETPLEGQYDWVKVENNTLNGSSQESQKENQCQDVATERCNISPSSKAFQNCESSDSGKRKQKLITDFYPVKRRCSPVPSLHD
ncbi:cyclin-dependent kinase inhibitor 1 [Xenopus laevis]|uniref:Cyclin dependent kinase inhibitor p16Xic2 n=1 Tax=Xenopus laevis TaxID=8355 RepID=Q5V9L9_XENLA|nr:cyclin-dependent kinase inhibitor 1 [Xenopus laevis]AAT88078.1 cyclin dependent kinase inhibitor p16Xic2 [Xenopus laevis]